MATVVLADNAYGTLGGALASTASSITFTAGHGARFPAVAAGQVLYACLLNSNNVLEEIQITTHTSSADTADVVRAIGGSTAKAWNAGDRIEVRLSSTAIRNLFADPLAVTGTGSSTIAGPLALSAALNASGLVTATSSGISVPTGVLGNTYSSTYTPTVSATVNVASSTPNLTTFTRVGNYVHVSGNIVIDPTSAVETQFELSLPVASNFANSFECGGTMVASGTYDPGIISGSASNNTAVFTYVSDGTGVQTITFTFGYRII